MYCICIVLDCTISCCIVLCCVVLRCVVLQCIVLWCVVVGSVVRCCVWCDLLSCEKCCVVVGGGDVGKDVM